jgi:hypothetical protein
MIIRAMFRQEFARIVAAQSILNDFSSKAVEWFADDSGNRLGAIAYYESDLNWSIVVLDRGRQANFGALYLEFGFWSCDDARRLLFEKMAATVGTSSTRRSAQVRNLKEHSQRGPRAAQRSGS